VFCPIEAQSLYSQFSVPFSNAKNRLDSFGKIGEKYEKNK
jgi:hypothetical protein